jgi:integrase
MLYKRSRKPSAHWWVRFSVKGVEVRQSSGTDRKELAEAFEQSLREAIWREQNLGEEVHTWEEACERWCKDKAHKRSLKRDRQAIKRLDIKGSLELSECVGEHWLSDLQSSNQPAARELAVLRSILNAAVTWGWLDKAPKVVMPHEEKHEPRWITKEQFQKLCKELPPHAAQLARFAVATGLRRGNVFRLKWEAVDVERRTLWVGARAAKSRKSGGFPLSADAVDVLKRQSDVHPVYVFSDDEGKAPVGSIKTCWGKAVRRAGLDNFRFHDLRHTWAAWHTLAGTPPIVLMELGGWSSLAMVTRYAHLNPGHLSQWADNSRTNDGTRKMRKARKTLNKRDKRE